MLRTNFEGDPNIGLYGFATDRYCIIGNEPHRNKIEKQLDVKCQFATIFNTGLIGIFAAGNSNGIIVPEIVEENELERIHGIEILRLNSKYTALGNLILMNDKGIILSPLLRKEKKGIEKFFGIRCEVSKIAGISVVGNLGIATNKGCLLHPRIKKDEMKLIEEVLGVNSDIGTVNFGSPYPGSGIIANSNGFVVSEQSSGPELGRINEALGFL